MSRSDASVALVFVLAGVAQALAAGGTPAQVGFDLAGTGFLLALAFRRRHPVATIGVITLGGLIGVVATAWWWPDAPDDSGVWPLAMVLASYSVGAHSSGRRVAAGVLFPLLVVGAADASAHGWQQVQGVLFVTVFVGALPTAAGRLVCARRRRLDLLHEQRRRIAEAHRAQQESAALAERVRSTRRLQPTLVAGLDALAEAAERGEEPHRIETRARELLARTREEVVALTAPLPVPVPVPVASLDEPDVDHLRVLRSAARPWIVIWAGTVTAGLYLESTQVLRPATPPWQVLLAALAVGAPLLVAWWRPLPAVALAWVAVSAYSAQVAALHGTLSESGFALTAAFVVGALSSRRAAALGLAVCWAGQLVGLETPDPFGEAVILLLCWLGGIVLNETSRLVELTRATNEIVLRQEAASSAQAAVAERLRLAREIHDAIGHSLTVVALQAGAARRLSDQDPARAAQAMVTVGEAARSGLTALAMTDEPDDIALLVERVRATGLEVDADTADALHLAPELRATVVRVVQEGLTNVLRHAPGSRAHVVVRQSDDGWEVTVSNSASPAGGGGPGTRRGLQGIGERVTAGAGRVSFGPRDDGGFELRAWLPAASAPPAVPSVASSPTPATTP